MKTSAWITVALVAAALGASLALQGCSTTVANVDPTGSSFPRVRGEALSGEARTLPDDLAGAPAVLLVGYVQGAQFDLDRWLVALAQAKTPAQIVEVPTIDGLVPTAISGWIDGGMRSGIPSEDWGSVVTVYGKDAASIVERTGNAAPRNARVFLLDAQGNIVWFHDRGFSASKFVEIDTLARALPTR